jgi:hypothetical protein
VKIGMTIANKIDSFGSKANFKEFEVHLREKEDGYKSILVAAKTTSARALITNANSLNDTAYKMMAGLIRNIKPDEKRLITMARNSKVVLVRGGYEKCADLIGKFVTALL